MVKKSTTMMAVLIVLGFMITSPALAADGLVSMLTSGLGINDTQAAGAAGAVFNLAKSKLSGDEFTTVAKAVPEMDTLLSAAPETGKSGGLASMAGKALGSAAGLAGSFDKLGLDAGMVGQVIPMVLDYVKGNGGETVMKVLAGALK
ncbi:MAG: DUF2780 domain-containing protein [Deltaproteobacteria bacterium]|nr:MAG: DUF2780 domain-containing protein [Deltaproteobacteria bacterium]